MLILMHSRIKRYGVAILAVLLALLLTHLLWLLHKLTIYPLFLAAVMVSSWYGGSKPGLVAIVLSALACAYFFIPPLGSLALSGSNVVGLVQFVLVALLICTLNAMLRSAQRQAQYNYHQLQQSQESLRQSEERYRLLVEGVTNYAIFMLDAGGRFLSWNVGAQRMLGYQEAEIIGQSFEIIFTPEAIAHRRPQQALTTAVTNGFARDNRWHVRKNGTQFWAYCIITPLRDDNGNLRGFAKIMQDITERKQAEEEREQLLLREQAARADAEAANRAKDDFLAVVSHELRTPMTAIVGWAGMLLTGMLDEVRIKEAIETIERNANSQLQLIEDLLDISRIVRGELALNFDWVDLVAVITEALEVVQPTAEVKNIQLEFVQATSVEPIWGDSDRLQQVLLNLLSNAIKFTPNEGRVEVRLAMEMDNEDESSQLPVTNYAQIQVIDTGIGISPDLLPYVFERFWQADSTSTRSNRGLGLGLAITRYLVESHGGTISVESRGIGQGATFTLKLPRLAAGEENAGQRHPDMESENISVSSSTSLSGLHILVVDDEADTRQWITIVLEECGAQVTAVGSVPEALAALEELRPDVLVSDIGMPGEDGYALIRKIREMEPEIGGRIPAVALTGYARVEDYTETLAAGFQLHVAKPVRAGELIAVVISLASNRRT